MIVTLENCKKYLGITDTSKDDVIRMLIPAVENDYLLIRGKAFNLTDDSDEGTDYPENSEVIASEMIAFKLNSRLTSGIKSEHIGSYSYSKDEKLLNGYPLSIVGLIERFQGIR